VFVNAAGNDGVDINSIPEWPAAFQIPGKITVASYNQNQMLSKFSNYGILVDLAAPGESILSTVPPANGQPESPSNLALKSGTSMATPFVAGVAALLYSVKPTAQPTEIVAAINNSVVPSGGFGVRTGGKLNALKAVQYILNNN
jgi:subtilisin family serine protease